MNDTNKQDNINPCGFKESITQTEIRFVDVLRMTPIEKPSASTIKPV